MSQMLKTMNRKDGKAKGVAIRKNSSTTPSIMKTLFNMAYQEHLKRQKRNGKSKV